VLAILGAGALGASSGLYIKGLGFSSLAMSSLRMTVPFLIVLPSVIRHGLLFGKPGISGRLFAASALNAVRMYLFILAFKLTKLGNAVVLLYLWPVFALVFDSARLKRPLNRARLAVLFLASAGVVVMNLHRNFSLEGSGLLGSLAMILSSLIFGAIAIVFKDALAIMKETDTLYFENAVGGLVFFPFLLAEIPSVPLVHLGIGIVYGIAVGALGFGLFFYAMKRLPLFKYSALSYTEIPFGLLIGMIFLGEAMTLNQGIGVVLILAGSFLAMRLRAVQ